MEKGTRLANRIALVTGASRGIGRAVAIGLAREGAHVVLLARTVGGLEEVDDEIRAFGGTATLVNLDLRQSDKVDALGPTLYQRWGKLDILVANAGVLGPLSPLAHITGDAWNEVIDVNLTANWRLIRSLDPVLRRADAARAVFVSSGAAAAKNAYWGPYAVSKAGLEALVKTYAQEVASTPIKVNLLNPGPVRTTMRQRAFPGENPATLPEPEALVPLFLDLVDAGQTESGRVYDFKTGTSK
ncbi:MAG TPA: SDR family NAD(P)-dependent oxidoreductase [Hyphomicrobiaceae bacterium]|nr:SDR family NAD(P)-dependent oxidoreductase [Hyphomicrobiaceae bacterium]